jgi:hypothetical protein
MRLFHFHGPVDYIFAHASRRGTWYPEGAKVCPECGSSRQKRVSPLIIEWESGSDMIGDFIWPGFDDELVIAQKVKDDFGGRFREIEFGMVEFWQNPRLKRPTKIMHRSKPRIWLPYAGPPLWDVLPKSWCHLDLLQSNVTIVKECLTCGKVIYKTPPSPQRNLVIDPATWSGEGIFHIHEYPRWIFCTELVKESVEKARFNNVSFLEDGVIPN